MKKGRIFIVLALVAFYPARAALAQQSLANEELFSPFNARTFHKLACELYTSSEPESDEANLAIIFLDGAVKLDLKAGYVFPDILNLCSQFVEKDYTTTLDWAFDNYADERADLEVTKRVVRYLIERLDTREAREEKLTSLLKKTEGKNPVLTSELTTQLGLLSAEKGDTPNALILLDKAYTLNPYNKLAFTKLAELSEKRGQKLHPVVYTKNFRLEVGANPLDINAVFAFAENTEKHGLYSMAASAYEYSAELFSYLYPNSPMPASIYLPWAIVSYNTARGQGRCLELARQIRQTGRFDVLLEAIAGSAARKIGDNQQSRQILEDAGRKAEKLLGDGAVATDVNAEQLGWFYCFGLVDTQKALAWANRAYSANSDSVAAKSILAYALAMNKQTELAGKMVGNLYRVSQVAALTRGMIQLAGENKENAIETLKAAVAMDPGSLAGEKTKTLLAENGSEYVSEAYPEFILAALRNEFGERIVPSFRPVDKIISAKLSLNGSEFFYHTDFNARLVVTNESSEPVLISDNGILKGGIRVDAVVRGDIEARMPNLVSKKIRPSAAIEPGYYAAIPLDLMTGPLRQLLLTHPQASVEIEFNVYLDPVTEQGGKVRNAIARLEPVKTVVKRPGVVITKNYLMQRLNVLAKGQTGQKLRVAELFVGLLMEQYATQESAASYRRFRVEPALLNDAVRKSLTDQDWKVKLHTMAAMMPFPAPPSYDLTRAVSQNLSDRHWPVRMMALYLLSSLQPDAFKPVLDWTAKYDQNMSVRNMAVALGADMPQVPQAPQAPAGPGQKQ